MVRVNNQGMQIMAHISRTVIRLADTFGCSLPTADVKPPPSIQREVRTMVKGMLAFRQAGSKPRSSLGQAATGIYRFQGSNGPPITIVGKPKPIQKASAANAKRGNGQ